MPYYSYICSRCYNEEDCFYNIGEAEPIINCSKCNGVSYRSYRVSVRVPNPVHPAREGRGNG